MLTYLCSTLSFATCAGRKAALLVAATWLAAAPPVAGQRDTPNHDIVPPRLLNAAEIARLQVERHPVALRDSDVSGEVDLEFWVSAEGTVDTASIVVEKASHPAFVEPAMDIVRRMRFSAATVAGTPRTVWVHRGVSFDLGDTIPPERRYALAEVEVMPRLRNARQVSRQIRAHYPPVQREGGVSGDVLLTFRVLEDGRVDPATTRIFLSTDPAFEEPAAAVARAMRFTPARYGPRPVKVWVTLPIHFEPPAR